MNNRELWSSAVDVWKKTSKELLSMKDSISEEQFTKTIKAIRDCKGRIITSGAGTSGAAAKKIAHTLSCIERPSFYLSPADAVHGALGVAQNGDIAILISKGGNTNEIVSLIAPLRKKGTIIIGVTENPASILGKDSDIFLRVKVAAEADTMNMLATTSTMAVIALFDAICITLMKEMNYTREQFSIIHPGGAVGKRLLEGLN
jgi:KpsF/GutQ family protein